MNRAVTWLWEEPKGSQAANAAAQVVLGVSSALLGTDMTQDNQHTPPRQLQQQTWQVRSISLFSLLSWSSDTAKKSKDAQKL